MDAPWETYNCRASRSPDGVITLQDLEPGYEYRATAHLLPGYTVMQVQRRKSDPPAPHDPLKRE